MQPDSQRRGKLILKANLASINGSTEDALNAHLEIIADCMERITTFERRLADANRQVALLNDQIQCAESL